MNTFIKELLQKSLDSNSDLIDEIVETAYQMGELTNDQHTEWSMFSTARALNRPFDTNRLFAEV